jgi:hypothetical protein
MHEGVHWVFPGINRPVGFAWGQEMLSENLMIHKRRFLANLFRRDPQDVTPWSVDVAG